MAPVARPPSKPTAPATSCSRCRSPPTSVPATAFWSPRRRAAAATPRRWSSESTPAPPKRSTPPPPPGPAPDLPHSASLAPKRSVIDHSADSEGGCSAQGFAQAGDHPVRPITNVFIREGDDTKASQRQLGAALLVNLSLPPRGVRAVTGHLDHDVARK